jgi:hypothetical protein
MLTNPCIGAGLAVARGEVVTKLPGAPRHEAYFVEASVHGV